MLTFLKNLLTAIYDATVGGLVRVVRNTLSAKVDAKDNRFISRALIYVSFFVVAVFFPTFAIAVALLRTLMAVDVFGTIATIFQLTANAYAE